MAAKGKGKGGRSKGRSKTPEVTFRFQNEGRQMAKKKGGGGKKKGGAKRGSGRKGNSSKKGSGRRRRRNPPEGFGGRAMRLAGVALLAVGVGAGVTIGASKISPGSNWSMYGIPLATFGVGAALAKSHPMIGVGLAVGAVAPFAPGVAARVLTPSTAASAKATAGLGRAARTMRAIDMGAVDMGAVDLGSAARRHNYARG